MGLMMRHFEITMKGVSTYQTSDTVRVLEFVIVLNHDDTLLLRCR